MSQSLSLFAQHALLPQGWVDNVRLHWNEAGDLTQVETEVQAHAYEKQECYVIPGMTNLHSHAFQRAMAGMTEIAGEGPDSFWTWRDLMYRFALAITPEQIQTIAAQLYSECLRYGYTSVCEFHYLHRAPDGQFYQQRAEMAARVIAAAEHCGMGISMLPVLYSFADFKDQPLRDDQRRFRTNVDDILGLIGDLEALRSAQVEVGVAPHSLRAANPQQIQEVVKALPKDRPIHIHIAEQMREVEASLAATGQRPVELLLNTQDVDARWCLVHATHLTSAEVRGIAQRGAVAGICTTTEGNLGDGFFELPEFIEAGGVFGIGSDSHVSQSAVEEVRWLEYGQRLRLQKRNVASVAGRRRVADFLWQECLKGGAQASGRRVGQLSPSYRADFVVLDADHPNLHGLNNDQVLSSFVFSGNDNLVRDVYVGGSMRVQNQRHLHQEQIQNDFRACMQVLRRL